MDVVSIFTEFLRKNDLKFTPERITVLDEIRKTDQHFEPDSLLIGLKSKKLKISRATIYRTLELLVQSGLVKKNIFADGSSLYEKNFGISAHDHFVCVHCGLIIEFFDTDLVKIHNRLATKHNLAIQKHSHQIYGLCQSCRE